MPIGYADAISHPKGAVQYLVARKADRTRGSTPIPPTDGSGRLPIAAGEDCAIVESVKAASDIFAPLGGRITETNSALADDPALVNRDPAGEGWFFRLAPSDPAQFDALRKSINS